MGRVSLVLVLVHISICLYKRAMLIDRNKIESANLSDLGNISQVAAVYDESVLDAGVCAQVEETLRKKSTLKQKIQQNLENIRCDIQ